MAFSQILSTKFLCYDGGGLLLWRGVFCFGGFFALAGCFLLWRVMAAIRTHGPCVPTVGRHAAGFFIAAACGGIGRLAGGIFTFDKPAPPWGWLWDGGVGEGLFG